MASNPYVNKVEYGGNTLIDLTNDTVQPNKLLAGETAHDRSGSPIQGSLDPYVVSDPAETTIDDADYFPFYDSSASGKRKSLWSNIKAVLKAYFDTLYNKLIIAPAPSSELTEAQIVSAINSALANNENVASLFGIQQWSNVKVRRFVYDNTVGTVGISGIGEWQDVLNNPTAQDEAGWGWWYDDYFKSDEVNNASLTHNLDLEIGFDTDVGETITLGGWLLDTDNGYLCIRFGEEITNTQDAVITVDFKITRNSIS